MKGVNVASLPSLGVLDFVHFSEILHKKGFLKFWGRQRSRHNAGSRTVWRAGSILLQLRAANRFAPNVRLPTPVILRSLV